MDLLLTMASNGDADPMFDNWNTLLLEIFYLFLRGVSPSSLARDQSKVFGPYIDDTMYVDNRMDRNRHKTFVAYLP